MAKNKKPAKIHNLSYLANVIGKLRYEDINWDWFLREQLTRLSLKVVDALKKTEVSLSTPEKLVWALYEAMEKSKEKATHYAVPVIVTYRTVGSWIRTIYPSKEAFLAAPFTIGAQISDDPMYGFLIASISKGRVWEVNERVVADAHNAREYAAIQKMYSNILKAENFNLAAREFVKRYGTFEVLPAQDINNAEVPLLHKELADILWQEPEKAKT